MGLRLLRLSLRHQAVLTAAMLFGLVLNLVVIGTVDPPSDSLDDGLPNVAQCQGGSGPGCAEQPLIPPPAVGLPRFDAPPAIVFGVPAVIQESPPDALHEAPLPTIDRPPLSQLAA
jgi:hypothetical protein